MKWKFIFPALLCAFWLCWGCSATDTNEEIPTQLSQPDRQLRVACVGDSVTYGYGIHPWPEGTYPKKLQDLLGDGYIVKNFGINGAAVQHDASLPYQQTEQYWDSLAFQPDYVVFMMGSNDSTLGNWRGGNAYRKDLEDLLESYGGAKVILCTIPAAFSFNGDPVVQFGLQPDVTNEIAGILRDVAAQEGYPLVDIHQLTLNHPEWFLSDGVHPDTSGTEAIAQAVFSVFP